MKLFILTATCAAMMLSGCSESDKGAEPDTLKQEDVVKAAPIEGVRDMNVKAPTVVEADVLLNTGINFGPWQKMNENPHTVDHRGHSIEVTDTYFVREVWHAVYDLSVSPPKGERQTICLQVMVRRDAGNSALSGNIGKYNMECTGSADEFSDHPSLKEKRDAELDEMVNSAFAKWRLENQ